MGLKPGFTVKANTQDVTAAIQSRFVSLTINDQAGLVSDTLEIVLADHLPDAPVVIPSAGAELEVSLGYDGKLQPMGLFIVDGVDLKGPPAQLVIKAKASVHVETPAGKSSLASMKSRSFDEGLTIADLVKTIAEEHGLEPVIAPDLAGVELPHIDQVRESDMGLLSRIAQTHGGVAKPAGGRLIFAKRGATESASGKTLPAVVIDYQDVTSWSVQIAKRGVAGKVTAMWHDTEAAADVEVAAGGGEPVIELRHPYANESEAKAAVDADYKRRLRGEQKLSLTLPGRTDLIAEAPLTLTGFRDGINGKWLTTTVQHALDTNGYRCSVQAETLKG